jgi:D-alanyl-D-alanine carboxypeptidase (penicillin-binding protein 5/6)
MKNFSVDNKLLATLICVLFLAGLFFKGTALELAQKYEQQRKEDALYSPIPEIALKANAAYVFDITQNRPIYLKHESWKLPLASLAKIMTVIVAKENLPEDELVTIQKSAIKEVGDNGLRIGEKWKLDDLIKLMLTASSNDAAHAVASAVEMHLSPNPDTDNVPYFVEKMNETAKHLELSETSFKNGTGLDLNEDNSGAYGSAEDVGSLFLYAYKKYPDLFVPTTLPATIIPSLDGKEHPVLNTDTITDRIPHLLASKTGFTDIAGGNLALIFKANNEEMIAVVLGSSREGRFDDMRELVRAAYTWTLRPINMAVQSELNMKEISEIGLDEATKL